MRGALRLSGFLIPSVIVVAVAALSWGTVNVYLSTAAPAALQAQFIKDATTQYNATIETSPYPGTYTLRLSSKKPVAPPPPTTPLPCTLDESITELKSIATETYPYAFGNGMDSERYSNTQLIYSLQSQDYVNKTCGGYQLSASTTSCFNTCVATYDHMISTISARWGYVFDPKGQRVYP